MIQLVLSLLLVLQVPQDKAVETQDQPPPARPNMFGQMRQLLGALQQFPNWDDQYTQMMDAIETVFVEQGWDTESDEFSLKMVREVEALPPWQFQQRFDTFVGMLAERYNLDDDQQDALRQIMIRDATQMFAKNGDKILSYALEAINTRAAGQPFTPDQVAKWSKDAEPVVLDARRQMKASTEEFMQKLRPDQRPQVEADFQAFNKRADRLDVMSRDWKQGKWSPAEWGMANDPIQNGTYKGPANRPGEPSAPEANGVPTEEELKHDLEHARQPTREREPLPAGETNAGGALAPGGNAPSGAANPTPAGGNAKPAAAAANEPNDPWAQYVREFIRKYQLNDEQTQKAWLFHKDAIQRRDATLQAASKGGATSQPSEKTQSQLTLLFDRLKQRLDILPTRAQRRAAEIKVPAEPKKAEQKPEATAPK